MQVSDLMTLFADLARIVQPAGAKAAGELQQVAEFLVPFEGQSIPELANLLSCAEEYRRTGILPITVAKSKPAKSPQQQPSEELIHQLARELQEFDLTVKTPTEVERFVQQKLGKLTASTKTSVAKQMGIKGAATGPKAIKEITARLQGKLQMTGQSNATQTG